MKYPPRLYAKALSEVAAKELSLAQEKGIIHNFLSLLKKNGDSYQLKKIVAEAEKLLRAKTGKRKITIETARPVKKLETLLAAIAEKSDIVEEKINSDLIAGVKVTINEEEQFDGTLKRKIDKLFHV
jgi:F0F1-type ATP synthase delta subunit